MTREDLDRQNATLLASAKAIQAKRNCDFTTAWLEAREEHPELVQADRAGHWLSQTEPQTQTIGAVNTGSLRGMTRISGERPPTPLATTGSTEDPSERESRLNDPAPLKKAKYLSSLQQLLAVVTDLQKSMGYSFERAFRVAVETHPELAGQPASGGFWGSSDFDLRSITKVGPATKAVNGFPAL